MTRTSKLTIQKITTKFTAWGLLATLAATVAAPVLADPASQQKNKNNWRNLAAAGAAIAGYGLLKGDKTATVLGAAGAAYSANRYETDRQHQSQDSRSNNRRYYRTYGGYNNNNGYNNGGQWRSTGDYGNGQYNNGQYNNGYNNNGGQCDNNGQYGSDDYQNAYARRDNGRHLGWPKHQDKHQDKHHDRDGGDRD